MTVMISACMFLKNEHIPSTKDIQQSAEVQVLGDYPSLTFLNSRITVQIPDITSITSFGNYVIHTYLVEQGVLVFYAKICNKLALEGVFIGQNMSSTGGCSVLIENNHIVRHRIYDFIIYKQSERYKAKTNYTLQTLHLLYRLSIY